MSSKNKKSITKYCIGCGLCESAGKAVVCTDSEGFCTLKPESVTEETVEFASEVCHLSSASVGCLSKTDIWGTNRGMFFGHSGEDEIRTKASSGGVITSLCIYLLEQGLADGIVQTGVSSISVIQTEVRISTTRQEVLSCCGSRYTVSSPLLGIFEKTDENKRYAFVGKPCDAAALRNYLELYPEKKKTFPYIFSFFCAGLPGKRAEHTLLKKLGTSEEECVSLTYRGNGWPGKTTAVTKNGTASDMPYKEAWGGILGRGVHTACRFCMDGIGERADISCGDAWYQYENGEPKFEEAPGRNVIIPRSQTGESLLQEAVEKGYVIISGNASPEYLKSIQIYQFSRKAVMKDKMLAHRFTFHTAPYGKVKDVSAFNKLVGKKERFRIFAGTVKRILQKKI